MISCECGLIRCLQATVHRPPQGTHSHALQVTLDPFNAWLLIPLVSGGLWRSEVSVDSSWTRVRRGTGARARGRGQEAWHRHHPHTPARYVLLIFFLAFRSCISHTDLLGISSHIYLLVIYTCITGTGGMRGISSVWVCVCVSTRVVTQKTN